MLTVESARADHVDERVVDLDTLKWKRRFGRLASDMLVSLTSHLLSVLQADALTRRNAGEAASQRVVRGRYQAPPHAAVSNLGECVMVLGLLAMTAELQPHLGDDFLDAEVEPQPPPPAAPPARQQAGSAPVMPAIASAMTSISAASMPRAPRSVSASQALKARRAVASCPAVKCVIATPSHGRPSRRQVSCLMLMN
ncbi:hypothetical protein A6V28_25015 [Escherichia coli]|nr:hypothetical protein M770_33665 [Pseudomonas aeruginosa VRFPA03]KTH94483.1 hypothetical protein ASV16_25975 [Enterobacter cloacae subsp. cloacae]OCO59428.1 hypothetical protein AN688_0221280 [Citrobacter freundii]ODH14141.1 hypothetical protein A6V28_25015 [Escherichia coli]OEH20719.1 hypothetical protein AN690_0221070 [Citrobacter freundii]